MSVAFCRYSGKKTYFYILNDHIVRRPEIQGFFFFQNYRGFKFHVTFQAAISFQNSERKLDCSVALKLGGLTLFASFLKKQFLSVWFCSQLGRHSVTDMVLITSHYLVIINTSMSLAFNCHLLRSRSTSSPYRGLLLQGGGFPYSKGPMGSLSPPVSPPTKQG